MRNHYFSVDHLHLLSRPEQWRFVCPAFPAEVEAAPHPAHQAWMAENSHHHAHPEILLVLGGEGHHGMAGKVYPYAPGACFYFSPFVEHDCWAPAWAPDVEQLWVMIVQDTFIIRHFTLHHGAAEPSQAWSLYLSQAEVGLQGNVLAPDAGLPAGCSRLRLLALVSALVGAAVQAGYAGKAPEDRVSFQEQIVLTVCRHIEETAGHGVNLDNLARISGYSKFHFLRLFKEYTGLTVHAYTETCRLRRMRELASLGLTKTEISASLGFSCLSAFSRWYRKQSVAR